ncbi:MAG: hypothetical protein ACYTAN_13045 [Planctomycetota bacterium]|jgi:hypothetical protein
MNDVLQRCLEDLEERIDESTEQGLLREWLDFTEGRFAGAVFSPRRERSIPPSVEWPEVSVNEALDDFDAMLLQQYRVCSECLTEGNGAPLSVRANYGTSTIPLLFGVVPFVMPPETDTLPTSVPLNDTEAIRRIVDAGMPDLGGGYGERVFETGERFKQIADAYPKVGRHVHIYHPDLQGPLDICEVIWGSDIFLAFYDTPGLVKALLDLVTETYIAFMKRWVEIVPFRKGPNVHWDIVHGGNIMLRNDSAMNISPGLFEEFSRPYDQRLLDEFGGGAVHFCGRGDHFIGSMSEMKGLHAVNPSQPDYNDMETIFANTVNKGIAILDLKVEAAEAALAASRDLKGRVHCGDLTLQV